MVDSVFYDLAETPEEAANLTARGLLLVAIEQRIKEEGWTQTEAAARLHVSQPRVSDLLNGKISKFSLDALVNMLAPVGLTFDVRPVECRPARTEECQQGQSAQHARVRRRQEHRGTARLPQPERGA